MSNQSAFLTLALEVAASPSDPLDSPGSSKRMMIDLADRLVDGAIDKIPAYLNSLPQEVSPTAKELARAFRRAYRLDGPRMEMDLSMRPDSLPSAWVESVSQATVATNKIPWPIVWTTRVMGWWFGIGRQDRQTVMKEAHERALHLHRQKIENEICHGVMRLTSVAVETELLNNRDSLLSEGLLRSITIRRVLA